MSEPTTTTDARGEVNAAGRYQVLEQERSPALKMAREMAALTIPSLMPPDGWTGSTELPTPWQSTGAYCVNSLTAKVTLALFPPGSPFFRLDADEKVLELAEKQQKGGADEINAALREVEKRTLKYMEQSGSRTVNSEGVAHLIVCGNGLLQILDGGKEKLYPLDRYVVKRDLADNVLEIIVKDTLSYLALPKRIQEFLATIPDRTPKDNEKNCDLYTWIKRTDSGAWTVHQEIEGKKVPGTDGTYPADKNAFLPLRWRKVPGSDYGRGHCEEYAGWLRSLEGHEESIAGFSAAAGKVLFLVESGGVTDAKKIAEAPNGAVVEGRADDVSTLQLEKAVDFQVVKATRDDIKKDLERAFLTTGSVQRDAERVTAEEIRAMINELESSLGGIYSVQAEEFQRPLILRIIHQLQRSGKLPPLPDGAVSPQIVTGVEGLGRASDLRKLDEFVVGLKELFGEEVVAETIDSSVYANRRAVALGVENNGLIRSSEQIAEMRQQKAMQSMTEKLGGNVIGAVQKGAELAQQNKTSTQG